MEETFDISDIVGLKDESIRLISEMGLKTKIDLDAKFRVYDQPTSCGVATILQENDPNFDTSSPENNRLCKIHIRNLYIIEKAKSHSIE